MDIFVYYLENVLFKYGVVLLSSYIVLSVLSIYSLRSYKLRSEHVKYEDLLPSFLSPTISLIAPAYNEQLNIVDNIRSLLSLHYSNFDVIIINDGSKDDTLKFAIEAYKMVLVPYEVPNNLHSKEVRGIYKSTIPSYKNLLLVDKMNGGKADALNAGINISKSKYVACIDVDCILEQDALLKLVKPFMDSENRVIATGGVIRIVNSCDISNGGVTKVNTPVSWVACMQVLEYLRAFLLGRMAWGKINGLMLISGAFGMFDREILIAAGGYLHTTVGEDMELVVRMSRYMIENKRPYKVDFIPDPLCWTECPEDHKILGRQRNRWTRGTIETLWLHKKMFFNPKYGVLGMLSYPYWFFFEFMAPLVEFFGILWFIIGAFLGWINWPFFYVISIFIYAFVMMLNMFAIFSEEISYHKYKGYKDLLKLLLCAAVEPFIYHPFLVYSAIKGNIDYWKGNNSWGEMTRKGMKTAT